MTDIHINSREKATLETMSWMISKEVETNFLKKIFRKNPNLDKRKIQSFLYNLLEKDYNRDPLFKKAVEKISSLKEDALSECLLENFSGSKKWILYYKKCIIEIFDDQVNYRKA